MVQWIGALVPTYIIVWLLQWASKKWRKHSMPLVLVHLVSLAICTGLWIEGGTGEGQTGAQLLTMGLLVYVPPQAFWLIIDYWGKSKPRGFFRGPSRISGDSNPLKQTDESK